MFGVKLVVCMLAVHFVILTLGVKGIAIHHPADILAKAKPEQYVCMKNS